MARLTKLQRTVEGRVALVTGAGSGIGRATAHVLADDGAHVAVTDRDEQRARAVAEEIIAAGGWAHAWPMDVTDEAAVGEVVDAAAERFGALHLLINNAGISRFAAIDGDDHPDHWQLSLDVLLTGQVRVVRAALPHLRRITDARIVNVASTEGLGATRYGSPYTTAKHGVVGLTRSLAVELGPEAITVNCVCPGPVDTAMTAGIPPEDKALFARRRTALRRYAEPEEIAHGIVNLCLPASRYTTGAVLVVDGGLTVRTA